MAVTPIPAWMLTVPNEPAGLRSLEDRYMDRDPPRKHPVNCWSCFDTGTAIDFEVAADGSVHDGPDQGAVCYCAAGLKTGGEG